ncbi:hypothetical protein WOC76_06975 [Methylocystis sp. IM3]|uniref:hypothetical protein n=1 Tax=unclassified Methylocystis TaxID=2625913 RepID=UPI0030F7E1CC
MTDDDAPKQIDTPASSWAPCERVVPLHSVPPPTADEIWRRHLEDNLRRRDEKPKPPPRARGIQRRV